MNVFCISAIVRTLLNVKENVTFPVITENLLSLKWQTSLIMLTPIHIIIAIVNIISKGCLVINDK